MPLLMPLICLLGMGLVTFRRSGAVVPAEHADPALRDDAPARLLGWAASLLSAQREEWGQAMLGELACIDGRARRWRFAVGCAGAALLLPPWGRAAAAVWAFAAIAAGGAALYASVVARYDLGAGEWVFAAIALVLLAGFTLVIGVQVRRPGVALPGLLGGLLVALAWAAPRGFTFYGLIVAVPPGWAVLLQLIVVPLALGAAGTLWGGSAAAGRRIARLAALTAGLGVFLYGTLAVAVIGAAGAQIDATWTVSADVADRLGNNAVFYLWFLPLTTAALGWAAATATARLHPRLATTVATLPVPAAGPVSEPDPGPVTVTPPPDAGPAARSRNPNLLLACAIVAAVVLLAAVSLLKG
jgi:hypothetical protein